MSVLGDRDQELAEELEYHLARRTEELELQGMPTAEARLRAEREFGDVRATLAYCGREDRRRSRRERIAVALRVLVDELVLAWRALVRRRREVLAPAAVLAVAVTLNVLVFTVVRGVLLAPLPFTAPERMAVVEEVTEEYGLSRLSYPVLHAWRGAASSVEALSAYLESEAILLTGGEPIRVQAVMVTEGFFDLLDRPLLFGRPLPDDAHGPEAPPLAVVSERLWRRISGGDPAFLDRPLRIDGRSYDVTGVVRTGAGFPEDADLWIALEPENPDLLEIAGAKILVGLARLRPGAEPSAVGAELAELSAQVDGAAPRASAVPLSDRLLGDVRGPLLLLQGAVLLVLLAACANAGGMLVARGVRRRGELAVRVSVGSGAGRLAGGLLLEGAVLGAAVGVVGLAAAAALLEPALSLVPRELPRADRLGLDLSVALFALALAVGTGLVTALAPAVGAARSSPGSLLKESSARTGTAPWLRRALDSLVVVQVALAVVLTAGAGLLLRSFVATVAEDPGFDPDRVTVVEVTLPAYRYPDNEARLTFARTLLERSAELPGATAVALGRNLPISASNMTSPLVVEAGGQTTPVQVAMVSADYFQVMGIALEHGRGFAGEDRRGGRPVLVVNASVRTQGGEPLATGSRAHSYFGTAAGPDGFRDVVDVARAVRHGGLREAPAPVAYEPFFQKGGAASFALLVRSNAPAGTVAAAAQELLRSLDPELPADRAGTMAARISRSVAGPRFYAFVLSTFGALAVLLALAGCHAGLAHRVASRRREIGLRMALGASRRAVRTMVLWRGLGLTAAGTLIGVALALPASRVIESQLYGVTTGDPATYAGVLVLLLAAGVLASDLPARRASRVDPLEVLRE